MDVSVITGKGLKLGSTVETDNSISSMEMSYPWDKKYQGYDLNTIILPKTIETVFTNALKLNSIGNYILHSGAPGTGKSSLAQAIPNMLGTEGRFLSCRKNAEILDEIAEYAIYKSPNGKPRFVILDEADKALNPEKFYRDLQTMIDSTKTTLRYILTCNEVYLLPDAIQSRCFPIDFSSKEEDPNFKNRIFMHLKNIVATETSAVGGTYEKDTIVKTIKMCFPDIRKMIGTLHYCFLANGGSIVGEPPIITEEMLEKIYEFVVSNNMRGLRYYLSSKVSNCKGVYSPFTDYMIDRMPDVGLIRLGAIMSDGLHMTKGMVDPEIMLWGTLCKVAELVQQLLKAGYKMGVENKAV